MDASLQARLDNDFAYHTPDERLVARFEALRAKAKEFAELIVDLTPGCREQSTALTKVDEAVMHANAAIARNQPRLLAALGESLPGLEA